MPSTPPADTRPSTYDCTAPSTPSGWPPSLANERSGTGAGTPPRPDRWVTDDKATSHGNAGYLAELASHIALDSTARRLGAEISTTLNRDAVVCLVPHANVLEASWSAAVFEDALERYERLLSISRTEIESLVLPEITGTASNLSQGLQPAAVTFSAPNLPGFTLGAVAQIAGLLRNDSTLTTRKVDKERSSLTAAVINALTNPSGIAAIVPTYQLIDTTNPILLRLRAINDARNSLTAAHASRQVAVLDVVRRTVADLETQINDLRATNSYPGTVTDRLTQLHAERRALLDTAAPTEAALANAAYLLDQVTAFLHEHTRAPTDHSSPALVAALVHAATTGGRAPTHLLHVQIDSLGADVITRKSLWNTSMAFLGGAAVSYMLMDTTSAAVTSGTRAATTSIRYSTWRNRITSVTTSAQLAPTHPVP